MQARGEGKDSGGRSAADAETLERIAAERFTCRAYLPDAVPTDVIERVVEIAKRAASWCNVQPWHAIVTSRDTTERFRAALVAHAAQHPGIYADMPFPDEYRGVYGERRREVGYRLYAALGIARSDRLARERQVAENFRLFGAPHVALLTIPAELGPYAALDCGAFVASFCWRRARTVSQPPHKRRSPIMRGSFAVISVSATSAGSSAASRSAMRT